MCVTLFLGCLFGGSQNSSWMLASSPWLPVRQLTIITDAHRQPGKDSSVGAFLPFLTLSAPCRIPAQNREKPMKFHSIKPAKQQATSLRPGQFKHVLRVASVTGRMRERDVMLLWVTHSTGIRVTELALLEIRDMMHPSGQLRGEVYLRGAITKHAPPPRHLFEPPKNSCLRGVLANLPAGARLDVGQGQYLSRVSPR